MTVTVPPLTAFLDSLAPAQMRAMLAYLYGRCPGDFLAAAAMCGQSLPAGPEPAHECHSCHGTQWLLPVVVPGGGVEHYCGDPAACAKRRHATEAQVA